MRLRRHSNAKAKPGEHVWRPITDGGLHCKLLTAVVPSTQHAGISRFFGIVIKMFYVFAQVRANGGTVTWPNGADLCPDVVIWGGLPPSDPRSRPECAVSLGSAERAGTDDA